MRLKLAVIGTFHGKFAESTRAIERVLYESSRVPDEFWVLCEDAEDASNARLAVNAGNTKTKIILQTLPTPRQSEGGPYTFIPYSCKINYALDRTKADIICHLDNGSLPHKWKFDLMAGVLESYPSYGAVYCTQKRTGFREEISHAEEIVPDAYCRLNYTQVMHRRTDDRWTLDMRYANPDLADAMYWRELHKTLGSFYPVPTDFPLDEHHMPSPAANGL